LPEGEKSVRTEKLVEIISRLLLAELILKLLTDLQAVKPLLFMEQKKQM